MERSPLFRTLAVVLIIFFGLNIAAALWVFGSQFFDIIMIFFLAWMLSFVLSPAVRFITDNYHLPRIVSAAAVYLVMIVAAVGLGLLILPPTVSQLQGAGQTIYNEAQKAPLYSEQFQAWLRERGINVDLVAIVQQNQSTISGFGTTLAQNALNVGIGVAGAVVNLVIILTVAFFMLVDGERISNGMLGLVPNRYREEVEYFFAAVQRSFGGYLRGAAIQAAVYGGGTGIVMWLTGLPFVLVASLFAGLFMTIPVFGGLIAIIPPLLLAAITGNAQTIIIVFVSLMILQQITLNVIAPKVMSDAVGIHPILVFAAFLVGARVAGLWGALFGVPIAAVLSAMATYLYSRIVKGERKPLAPKDQPQAPRPRRKLFPADLRAIPKREIGKERPLTATSVGQSEEP